MTNNINSDTVTHGIRIKAQPDYLSEHSKPENNYYVFAYHIIIKNESQKSVQLLSRHWIIINADGENEEVQGPGVVGKKPHLAPGESFDYTSYCPLNTEWGTMEGTYTMQDEEGSKFDVKIARFYLTTTLADEINV